MEEGRLNLTADLDSDLSDYAEKDYRRFLSAHLQFLQGLCQLSIQTVNISIQHFLSSLFATVELLSERQFEAQINSKTNQSRLVVPTTFSRLLFLIRMVNHGNAIITNYGTNFESINNPLEYPAYFEAIIYDNGCSCGLYSNCTTQANFITKNSTKTILIPIKGLKMGCTPSESFRASTLECFYDQSCINLIQQYTNNASRIHSTDSFNLLSTNNSQFSMNTTIAELIENLFIEEWNTSIDYFSYFQQCLPLYCSHTYIEKYNVLHTITVVFGLQGGLAIILTWICPKVILIIARVNQYRKKRTNTVQPICSVENVNNHTSNLQSISTNVNAQYVIFYLIRIITWIIYSLEPTHPQEFDVLSS